MLTALPARLQLLSTYTQYGFIRSGVIISVLRHCLVVSQIFKNPKISSLFFLKIAQNFSTVSYKGVSYKTMLCVDADCLSSSLASTGRQVFYHIY